MARRIAPAQSNVPPMAVPAVPAPAYPAAVPAMVSTAPPLPAPSGHVMPPVATTAVPPLPPPSVPGMEHQLQQAIYQAPAPVAPLPVEHTEWVRNALVNQPNHQAPANSPLHFDMGTEEVKVFKTVPAGEIVEAEITKAELGMNNNNNQQIKLQLRVTWPQKYENALFFDQVVLVATAGWKYKSLCAACEDEEGNRLLSADNRFFTGNSVDDFLGNVVRFKSDEPRLSANGNYYNQVKGGFEGAFETFAGQSSAVDTSVTPPPVPNFQ